MTTYNWSALASGANLGTLTTADIINFDTGSTPLDTVISWDPAGLVQISASGKGISFSITGGGRAFTDANFTFTNPAAGKVLIGDNTSSIGNGTSTFDDGANLLDNSGAGTKNDRLIGLNGNDTMNGGAGDDLIVVGNGGNAWGNDSVDGGAGLNDFIALGTSSTTGAVIDFNDHSLSNAQGFATFTGIENALGGSGDDQFYAFEAARTYTGRGGAAGDFTRIMEGFGGDDLFVGDQRDGLNDRVRFSGSPNGIYVNLAEEYALDGWDSDSTLAGVQSYTDTLRFIDDIQASSWNDTLLGGGLGTSGGGFFNEQFEGMAGNDLIDGNGSQNLSFAYFSSPSGVTVNLSTGTALDGFDSNSTLAGVQSYTDTLVGGTVSSNISGSNFNDDLVGDDLRTFLQGRGGNDTLDGRGGLDTAVFFYFQSPDSVTGVNIDLANATTGDLSAWGLGTDTLISIEGLRGGDLNDTLRGQNGVDNELDGRAGNDSLDGRSGNDRVRYDVSPNAVNVGLGTGTASDGFGNTDTLVSIENVRGSRFGDTIVGNAANNAIEGFTGADSMNGGGGTGDTLEFRFSPGGVVVNLSLAAGAVVAEDGWGFADVWAQNFENVLGGVGDDLITGSAVANRLDGGGGADTLTGGAGNDTFVVDNEGDSVVELAAEGTDTVESLIDCTLSPNLENLTLLEPSANSAFNPLGTSPAIRAVGNTVKNVIIGNSAANFIDGGSGNDDMRGGKGNDTYIVAQTLDVVKENANEGVDTVKSSAASYLLSANVENLVLTGSAAIGTGNDRANTLKGNAAINTLDGGGGNDTIDGGAGADELSGGAGTDQFIWDAADTGVDGGSGSQDRIIVKGEGNALNLNTLNGAVINDVEVFDIHGSGNNTLTVSAATALTMGGDLTVFANAGDTVTLNGTGAWSHAETVISYQGHLFYAWANNVNDAQILIETGATVNDI